MLTLFHCDECGRLRQEHAFPRPNPALDPITVWALMTATPIVCNYCKSLRTRNDLHLFYEPFVSITEMGCRTVTDDDWVPDWVRDALPNPPWH